MPPLSEFVLEMLAGDANLVLSRAVREGGERSSVLVLAPAGPVAASESVARLQHVYTLRDQLDPGWATTPRALAQHEGRPVLLLDDPSGATLLSRAVGSPWELSWFLRVGCAIAAALRQLHARGLVHKDVRPANVFISSADGKAWLTGFGIASRLPRERQAPAPPEGIAGTLAYMSPEQTGRMNRSIDSRSDLYSLGITLHELATGALPFSAADPMEWIHCHIAREPAPIGHALPPPLAAIVHKLLAKNAEDRYQTAAGVEADLRRCLADLSAHGRVDPFPLGEHDASDRLLIPEKLYGRDADVAAIRAAFERVVERGVPELVLVSGYSGIGKSSVVSELHKLLVPSHSLFASGKLDQYQRDVPYATIAQAFQSLLREILGKSDAELAAWRDGFLDALGANAQVLVSLIPELALVIGEQPPVADLPPQEAKKRFQIALRNLLGAFARKGGALALFLDDLQWLDGATLELVESLFTGAPVQNLLLIGAYRDNEVGPDHPLAPAIARIRAGGAAVTEVVLGPLSAVDLEQLLADSLRGGRERVAPLARLIQDKTGGNPFFAIQFLAGLVDEGLLAYDPARAGWSWDDQRVVAKGFTDNVADFMIEKLERLAPATQAAVRDLACLGNVTAIATLELVHGPDVDRAMWEAVRAGLVFRRDGKYGFLHDRVHEAAYALVPEPERPDAHVRIARRLAESPRRDEAIFDIVSHYERAVSLLVSADERTAVAQLNLKAGRRARAASAYASAETYFAAGRSLLADDAWDTHRELVFELELRRAECELVVGEPARVAARLSMLAERACDPLERAAVTCLRALLYNAADHQEDMMSVCLEYLRGCGGAWPSHPSDDEARRELERLLELVGERSIETLLDLPLMSDAVSRGTMDVLAALVGTAYGSRPNLFVLSVVHMLRLTLEKGNTDASALAYTFLALLVGTRIGRTRDGHRFSQLAVDLVNQRGLDRHAPRVWVVYAMSTLPWTRHIGESRALYQRTLQACRDIGEFGYAAYGGFLAVAARLGAGDLLDEVQRQAEDTESFALKKGFGIGVDSLTIELALIRMLRGVTSRFGWLEDEATLGSRYEKISADAEARIVQSAGWYWLRKLQARLFAGESADALAAAARLPELVCSFQERFELAEFHFYAALAHAAAGHLDVVREHHDKLAGWAEDCAENFGCRVAAVAAELARLEGRELDAERLYERAIRLAREHGFVQIEAIAGELAAGFHHARGFETIADAYLIAARDAYQRWGALGKVRQLDERFPGARPARVDLPALDLDLATVVKVSQAVSAEIVLDALIERLLTIAVENAGAERGLLILPRDGELTIEAQAIATSGGVEVHLAPGSASAPESILRYVSRARESVMLGDASDPGPFSEDPYVRAERVRSVLCLPLIKQTRLIGILYLENRFLPHVFTPRRIALLELLASQAAISLEHARLHAQLRAAEDQVRGALRENRVLIDTVPTQVWCTRPDASVEYLNRTWLEYTGLSTDQARDWGWTAAVHPEDAPGVLERWGSSAEGQPRELEARLRRHYGAYRWFLMRRAPVVDEQGRISRWYGTNTDIEELKRAEETIRRSEDMLLEAQRISHTGSFSWVPASGELYWSREIYRIFELDFGETPRIETSLDRMHPDDLARAREFVARTTREASDLEDEFRLLMPDGRVKHIQVIAHAAREEGGGAGFAGVVKDITAAKLEAARLTAALTEKEGLLKEVHHRVKNNLQLISSLLSLQAGRTGDRNVAELFADSRNRVRSMAMVHENLYRAGNFTRVAMADHLKHLCRELASIYRSGGPSVELKVTSSDLDLDMDRAISCGLIINELVSNAFKHAFRGGRPGVVSVELAPAEGGRHVLTVRDDGVGLPAALDVARVSSLGLQLVHDLVEQLHGSLTVTSGPGTTFVVTFSAGGER